MITQDFILNGQANGEVATLLSTSGFDPGMLRPYFNEQNVPCVTVNSGRKEYKNGIQVPIYEEVRISDLQGSGVYSPVFNATTLRKDEWITIDQQVIRAARQRLRAWSDLAAASSYGGFDGMSTTILEHETMSDPGEAVVDMDGLTEARNDSPKYQLQGMPLPITHGGWFLSARRLNVSRRNNTPIDVTMGEAVARRVAEKVEKTTIGIEEGITYGSSSDYGNTSKVYGYRNFPERITKNNMTTPTGSNGSAVLTSWLALRELLFDANHYGPFMVYVSRDYDQYLDNLFSTTEPSAGTLRSRLLQIEGISGIRRLDYLPGPFEVIMVQMTPDVAQAVTGLGLSTVQWESKGGAQINFRVMAIMVPRLRADYYGNTGIAHGTVS